MHPRGTTKAPASPHTTGAGGADWEGAPGQSEGKRGGGREEEVMGAGFYNLEIQICNDNILCY